MNNQPTPTLDPSIATRIDPTRDAATGRTVCFVQPAEDADQVELFSISGVHCGTGQIYDWPLPQPTSEPSAEPPPTS